MDFRGPISLSKFFSSATRAAALAVAVASLGACMTVKPATSEAQLEAVLKDGDLPLLDGATATRLIGASNIPVVVMFTAAWCEVCERAKPTFWRVLRQNEGRFTGGIVDIDMDKAFWRQHGEPDLPTVVVFDKGGARWTAPGLGGVQDVAYVLRENREGFVHGLSATESKAKGRSEARVFLVAAGADSANFGQEVVDQIEYWRARGLKDEQIACYWSVPNFGYYWQDREQFRRVGPVLRRCQQARLELLKRDWQEAAATKPQWLYLYVTSHGLDDRGAKSLAAKIKEKETSIKGPSKYDAKNCESAGKAHLVFDSVPGAKEALPYGSLFEKACSKTFENSPLMTEAQLADMMRVAAKSTTSVFVLQGCYSGAVVPKVLLRGTTFLAAASPTRTSFGCNVDGERTYFGEALIASLRRLNPRPDHWRDWVSVHDEVSAAVAKREVELEVPNEEQSMPILQSGPSD